MRKSFSNTALVAIAAGGMLFTSCGDRDLFNPNYKSEEYAANWEQKIGAIDPNQDWSMATTVTAKVNVAREGNFTVKVYSSNPTDKTQQAYLLAKTTVTGRTPATLTFDAIKGLDNVYVALINEYGYGITKNVSIENGMAMVDFYATNGNRTKTRTAAEFGWELTDYMIFTNKEMTEIVNALPEEGNAANKFNNYEFVSKGEFVIYPVYGRTSAEDEIGYYYYNPKTQTVDEKTEITIIENLQELGSIVQMIEKASYGHKTWNYVWKDSWNNTLETLNGAEYSLQAKGYAINVPAGYRVGFWIRNKNDKFYSNRVLNDDGLFYSAVVKHSSGDMFFGLEDWKQGEDNKDKTDCNDIVFFVKGVDGSNTNIPEPVDPNKTPDDEDDVEMSWILACEDLGSTDDYDFNDIVLEVQKDIENNQIKIKCLAAGGTLPATIYYDNNMIGEAHAMLGESNTGKMINTTTITNTPIVYTVNESIDQNWTLSGNKDKFRIVVNSDDNMAALISAPTMGNAPQMIIVPGDWKWPTERTKIEDAYSKFKDWNANSNNIDWYKTFNEKLVINRQNVLQSDL